MKAFKFRFDTLKKISEQKRKIIEAKLQDIFLQISTKKKYFYSYLNAVNKTKAELKTALSGKIDINTIDLYLYGISTGEKILAQLLEEIRVLEGKKEQIIAEYMKVNGEAKALEKLRSRLWSKYMVEYAKYENIEGADSMYFKRVNK